MSVASVAPNEGHHADVTALTDFIEHAVE